MLTVKECKDKIDDLTSQIRRYVHGTYLYEEEVPHLERLRKAYTVELSEALIRESDN